MITPTFTLDLRAWFKTAPDKEESLRDLIDRPFIRGNEWKFNALMGVQSRKKDKPEIHKANWYLFYTTCF
jgi:hypothetical protein